MTSFRIFCHRNLKLPKRETHKLCCAAMLSDDEFCAQDFPAVSLTQPALSSCWDPPLVCLSRDSASSDFLPACVLWDKSRWGNAVVKRESWRAMFRLPPKRPRPVTRRAAQPWKWVMISYYLQHQTSRFVCFTGMVSFVKVLKCPLQQ